MSPDEKRARLIEAAAALLEAAHNRRLNTVSLNKALFYLDLASLRDCGDTFTKASYVALHYGPVVAKYPARLLKPLEADDIAVQSEEGLANPVTLVKLPEFTLITPKVKEIARSVSRWCSGRSSSELSKYSHENPGWVIAFDNQRHEGRAKQIIDMNIAMQQIVDSDPWTSEPFSDASRVACEAADNYRGQPW